MYATARAIRSLASWRRLYDDLGLLALEIQRERDGIHRLGEIRDRLDDTCRLLESRIVGKHSSEALASRYGLFGDRERISIGNGFAVGRPGGLLCKHLEHMLVSELESSGDQLGNDLRLFADAERRFVNHAQQALHGL